MRRGGSKQKGSSFERDCCRKLSLWITNGRRADCLWRSAMSGGRATIAHKRGSEVRQVGDICAVSTEGHALTDLYYIECKHYANLNLAAFFLGSGILAGFWRRAVADAAKFGDGTLCPMVIAKQNRIPTLILTDYAPKCTIATSRTLNCHVSFFEEYLKTEKLSIKRVKLCRDPEVLQTG